MVTVEESDVRRVFSLQSTPGARIARASRRDARALACRRQRAGERVQSIMFAVQGLGASGASGGSHRGRRPG